MGNAFFIFQTLISINVLANESLNFAQKAKLKCEQGQISVCRMLQKTSATPQEREKWRMLKCTKANLKSSTEVDSGDVTDCPGREKRASSHAVTQSQNEFFLRNQCESGVLVQCANLQSSAKNPEERKKWKDKKCALADSKSFIKFVIDCPVEEEKAIKLCESDSFDLKAQFACDALAEYRKDSKYKSLKIKKEELSHNESARMHTQTLREVVEESKKNAPVNKLGPEGNARLLSFCLGYFETKGQSQKVTMINQGIQAGRYVIDHQSREQGKSAASPNDKASKPMKDFDKEVGQAFICDQMIP